MQFSWYFVLISPPSSYYSSPPSVAVMQLCDANATLLRATGVTSHLYVMQDIVFIPPTILRT